MINIAIVCGAIEMRLFMIRSFARFAKKEALEAGRLVDAIARAAKGSIDADLGGGLIKQRIARKGGGKRGGYRTLIAYRAESRAVFLYGFAKNERDNVRSDELRDLQTLGTEMLELDAKSLVRKIDEGALEELSYDEAQDEPDR